MAKKNFTGGLSSLINPSTSAPEQLSPAADANEHEEHRATFIVRVDLHDKISAIAYWERGMIKDMVNEAFEMYIADYEKKNGPIKLPPKKKS